jgi:hypothetical protein
MWYDPSAFAVGKRDVIAAWIICLAITAPFLGWLMVESLIGC